jgi:hypothetical protein
MEAVSSSETSLTIYRSIWSNISANLNISVSTPELFGTKLQVSIFVHNTRTI